MLIETESGSKYEFDLAANTVRRVPGEGASQLRQDEEVRPLIRIPRPPVVGTPFVFVLDVRGDGVETVRTTTAVTNIEWAAP